MKKPLLLLLAVAVMFSCKNDVPPKDIAKQFLEAAHSSDATTASSLATNKTKDAVSQLQLQTPGVSAEETYALAGLTETQNGNVAEVKNEVIRLSLEKEADGWKVAATPELVTAIKERPTSLQALKENWEALVKEYDARLRLAKEYVAYKKVQGALSAQMQTLEQMVATLSTKTTWNRENIQLYVQRQGQLTDLIDKSIEPSYTANADISMNYILQLHNADERVAAAVKLYQAAAQKTASITYPALSLK